MEGFSKFASYNTGRGIDGWRSKTRRRRRRCQSGSRRSGVAGYGSLASKEEETVLRANLVQWTQDKIVNLR
ncbi:hypothetical protein GYH30_002815 [Glycine max]|nr:hypothetical protein GYH30_002815 [Glycine max]